jgi:hypothetical protein
MAYGRVRLTDLAPGGLGDYSWPANYSEEGEFGRRRNYERTASTSGVGVVRQQGDDGPVVISVTGTILEKDQHSFFCAFMKIGKLRTLIFTDFEGHQYEVLMTAYLPTRQRAARNPRDPSILLHYYKYQMEMEAVRVLSGPWAGI